MKTIIRNIIPLLLITIPVIKAFSNNSILLNEGQQLLDISSKLLILEDENKAWTIDSVVTKKFTLTTRQVPNLGFSKSNFWIKIPITNKTKHENLFLELSLPILDYIEFYTPIANNQFKLIKMGEEFPFYSRKYKDPNYLFELKLPKGETKIFYIKVRSNEAIQLPIKIGTEDIIFNQIKKRDILFGIYAGIMLVMILYNLFIYFSVKDRSYIYYVIYIMLILITQTTLQGYPFQYLWPNFPIIAKYSLFVFPSIVGIAAMVFMNIFLKVKYYNKLLFRFSYLFTAIYIVPIFLAFFQLFEISQKIMEINAMTVSIYMLITIIVIYKKGYQPAKYFLIAWIIFLVGVIVFILKDFEVLPFNNFTRYTMQIGSAFETVLLSFALAARINIYKKEKEESQHRTVEVLKENEKIIREQNIVLEKKVDERTSELNKTLNHLKATQSQLVDAEKMSSLGQLTAGIAHEINNPINFVSSNITPLRRDIEDITTIIKKYEELKGADNLEEKLKEIEQFKNELDFNYLKTELNTIINGIEDGATRTKEIVSGLRNFSRLDEGELKVANINEGIESTLVLIKNKLKNIQLNKQLGQLPNIECYPGKLNQLFLNIIDNAIGAILNKKETNYKGIIDVITLADDNFINIIVKDNGTGIQDELKDKIFEPFFTTKDIGEGTGLGLSIVHSIAKAHHGEIQVKSERNKGTEITVKIPIRQ